MLDVSRTAGGIAQTFADYAGENRIAYRTAVGSGVLFPSVRNILMMIFNILLSNAFRRTEPGGEVRVMPLDPEQYVDIGIGVTKKDMVSPAAARFIAYAKEHIEEMK